MAKGPRRRTTPGELNVASFHLSSQIIGRSKGRSAIKAAAYRAGERLADIKKGEVYDFSRRRGVAYTEILLPDGAAEWMADRERFWNHAEGIEKRADAQLAREINLALPHELTFEERRELLLNFVREQFVSRGMVADIAMHDPVLEKGDHPHNFHGHIMLSLRQATGSGLRRVKTREWNSDELLTQWRAKWADHQNRALAAAGHRDRVDHRTLKAQREDAERRKDRVATAAFDRQPEIHVGPRAFKAAQRNHRPASQDRTTGPHRRTSRSRSAQRRTVRYSRIDTGSRLERNMAIIDANLRRMDRHLAQWQQRAARFRTRRQWIAKEAFETERRHQNLQRERQRHRLWQKRRDRETILRAMTETSRRTAHRRSRATVIDTLLVDIDKVIASLLGIHAKHLSRRHHLSRRRPTLAARRGQGRFRARHPTFPSSKPPSSRKPW